MSHGTHICAKLLSTIFCALTLVSCTATAQPGFEFKSIYSPTNTSSDFRATYDTKHVDYDWDLWGHNLKKIVGDTPSPKVFATIDGKMNKSQFCFTSNELYNSIQEYILDQYGEGTKDYSARICIMPQDNKLACLCSNCKAKGNTPGNATPAVTSMLRKLAKRFPRHQFFTSSYHSTRTAPSEPLPDNVGVLLSAYELQLRVDFTHSKGYDSFIQLVSDWKQKAKNIYVWDYSRNYEDYLTPFPCLHAMQSRLKLYREMGLNGVFVNDSGDEYASFGDLQTTVMAQLLNNPDIDVDQAITDFFHANYPATADLLCEYYLALENRTVTTNHMLPIYGTMQEMEESYLDCDEFTNWRQQLDKASKTTEPEERHRLNYLLTALSFTQLQILAQQGDSADPHLQEDMIEVLKGHNELQGMQYYCETYKKIDDYIKAYKIREY